MATHSDWRIVSERLRQLAGTTTEAQLALAEKLGVELDPKMPSIFAATALREAVAGELNEPPASPMSYGQTEFLAELEGQLDLDHPSGEIDRARASAWIEWMLIVRAERALQQLKPAPGDLVEVDHIQGEIALVSSISDDGRVNLQGRGGRGKWPHLLRMVVRVGVDDDDAKKLRKRVKTDKALSIRPGSMSMEKQKILAPYRIEQRASVAEIELLRDAINSAETEAPIQKLLQKYPQLLATIDLSGHATYVRAQVRIAGKLIPDFMIATEDSAGLHWTYVELESPRQNMGLQNGKFAEKAREGIDQINDWRNLVQENLDLARKPENKGGAALPEIRPSSPGLVIIGRRYGTRLATDDVRNTKFENEHIRVHTYDWLLEMIEGASSIGELRDPDLIDYWNSGW